MGVVKIIEVRSGGDWPLLLRQTEENRTGKQSLSVWLSKTG